MNPRLLKLIFQIAIFKTIYANLRYFKLNIAFKFPIIIFRDTNIKHLKRGNIVLVSKPSFGMLLIGIPSVEFYTGRTVFDVDGKLFLSGRTLIGSGSYVLIGNEGCLRILGDFEIKATGKLMITSSVTIGNNCLFSWNVTLMDTDWHKIYNLDNQQYLNPPKPIKIDNNVWVGCNVTILKGVIIPQNTVIAANSLITKSITISNSIITSNNVLKNNIYWTK